MTKRRKNAVSFYALNIILSLLTGFLLYILLRQDTWINLFFGSVSNGLLSRLPEPVTRFLRNYGADLLWAYALAFSATAVMSRGRKLTAILCACFAVLVELLQKTGIFYGTFDVLDILAEWTAMAVAFIIIHHYEGGTE